MSLLSALDDQDNKLEHGWSQANRFTNSLSSQGEREPADTFPDEKQEEEHPQIEIRTYTKDWQLTETVKSQANNFSESPSSQAESESTDNIPEGDEQEEEHPQIEIRTYTKDWKLIEPPKSQANRFSNSLGSQGESEPADSIPECDQQQEEFPQIEIRTYTKDWQLIESQKSQANRFSNSLSSQGESGPADSIPEGDQQQEDYPQIEIRTYTKDWQLTEPIQPVRRHFQHFSTKESEDYQKELDKENFEDEEIPPAEYQHKASQETFRPPKGFSQNSQAHLQHKARPEQGDNYYRKAYQDYQKELDEEEFEDEEIPPAEYQHRASQETFRPPKGFSQNPQAHLQHRTRSEQGDSYHSKAPQDYQKELDRDNFEDKEIPPVEYQYRASQETLKPPKGFSQNPQAHLQHRDRSEQSDSYHSKAPQDYQKELDNFEDEEIPPAEFQHRAQQKTFKTSEGFSKNPKAQLQHRVRSEQADSYHSKSLQDYQKELNEDNFEDEEIPPAEFQIRARQKTFKGFSQNPKAQLQHRVRSEQVDSYHRKETQSYQKELKEDFKEEKLPPTEYHHRVRQDTQEHLERFPQNSKAHLQDRGWSKQGDSYCSKELQNYQKELQNFEEEKVFPAEYQNRVKQETWKHLERSSQNQEARLQDRAWSEQGDSCHREQPEDSEEDSQDSYTYWQHRKGTENQHPDESEDIGEYPQEYQAIYPHSVRREQSNYFNSQQINKQIERPRQNLPHLQAPFRPGIRRVEVRNRVPEHSRQLREDTHHLQQHHLQHEEAEEFEESFEDSHSQYHWQSRVERVGSKQFHPDHVEEPVDYQISEEYLRHRFRREEGDYFHKENTQRFVQGSRHIQDQLHTGSAKREQGDQTQENLQHSQQHHYIGKDRGIEEEIWQREEGQESEEYSDIEGQDPEDWDDEELLEENKNLHYLRRQEPQQSWQGVRQHSDKHLQHKELYQSREHFHHTSRRDRTSDHNWDQKDSRESTENWPFHNRREHSHKQFEESRENFTHPLRREPNKILHPRDSQKPAENYPFPERKEAERKQFVASRENLRRDIPNNSHQNLRSSESYPDSAKQLVPGKEIKESRKNLSLSPKKSSDNFHQENSQGKSEKHLHLTKQGVTIQDFKESPETVSHSLRRESPGVCHQKNLQESLKNYPQGVRQEVPRKDFIGARENFSRLARIEFPSDYYNDDSQESLENYPHQIRQEVQRKEVRESRRDFPGDYYNNNSQESSTSYPHQAHQGSSRTEYRESRENLLHPSRKEFPGDYYNDDSQESVDKFPHRVPQEVHRKEFRETREHLLHPSGRQYPEDYYNEDSQESAENYFHPEREEVPRKDFRDNLQHCIRKEVPEDYSEDSEDSAENYPHPVRREAPRKDFKESTENLLHPLRRDLPEDWDKKVLHKTSINYPQESPKKGYKGKQNLLHPSRRDLPQNWDHEESQEFIEHFSNPVKEGARNWQQENSPDSREKFQHTVRREANTNLQQKSSLEFRQKLSRPLTEESSENLRQEETEEQGEDSEKESYKEPEDWQHLKSQEQSKSQQDTETQKPAPNRDQGKTSKDSEDWKHSRIQHPNSDDDLEDPDWEGSSFEGSLPSDLSEDEEFPDIDLPEPVGDNRQPIIQEIREQDIVAVPSNIINSTPGTPQAHLVSTPRGRSILVHSKGDKFGIVSSTSKQSPQQQNTQIVSLPNQNLYELLSKKDNQLIYRQRTPNTYPRFPRPALSARGAVNPRFSNNPRVLNHPRQVPPHLHPLDIDYPAYHLASLARGRGRARGRGNKVPSDRGTGNRGVRGRGGRGSRTRGFMRPPRGRGNQDWQLANILPNRFPNQVNNIRPNQTLHNASQQTIRLRGIPVQTRGNPRIITYAVRSPSRGSARQYQIITSGGGNQISGTLVTSANKSPQVVASSDGSPVVVTSPIRSPETTSQSQSPSHMIVDHEYAAPQPTNGGSDGVSKLSDQQGTEVEESHSSETCQVGFETTVSGGSQGDTELNQTSSAAVTTRTSVSESSQSDNSSVNSDGGKGLVSPNRKNTIAKGHENLEKNTVYLIKSKDSEGGRMYLWDGENFQEYNQDTHTIESPNAVSGNMSGGGVGENTRSGKQIRGNSTGLNMTQNRLGQTGNPPATAVKAVLGNANQAVRNDILPNGRTWKHASVPLTPKDNLARRPLHSERDRKGPVTAILVTGSSDKQKSITVLSSSSSSQESTTKVVHSQASSAEENMMDESKDEMEQQIQESKKRKRLEESGCREGECVVHCKYCGYSSSNVMHCDRCHRLFPDDVKIEPVAKKGRTCVNENDKHVIIDKKAFYGQKMNEQSQVYQTAKIVQVINEGTPTGRQINIPGKSYRMVRVSSSRKKPLVPVTVTISSDEEEDGLARPPSSGSNASGVAEEGDSFSLSQVMADIPNTAPSSPKFNKSRVKKMEDEMGNPIILRKAGRKINVIPMALPKPDAPDSARGNQLVSPVVQQQMQLSARSIRIGSLRGVPIEPVFVSEDGVFLFFECEDNSHKITIPPKDIVQCLISVKRISVIFIRTTPEFGQHLREQLGMENESSGPYFDPQHPEMKHQFLTLILQDHTLSHCQNDILNIFSRYCNSGNETDNQSFACVISENDTQKLLVEISPEGSTTTNSSLELSTSGPVIENQMDLRKTPVDSNMTTPETKTEVKERSPSPKIMFTGPVKKLITYPPPPATGGIAVTNEDLFCLTEGEFLNDVIIDFYLKYLLLDRLSEEDRKRTHLFSSFFFKRLTQRHAAKPEEASMTPAEKRHNRVKTWTKQVDLFEKDFIVVPINEHSHWFLAIICFPGKLQCETVTFIPKNRVDVELQISNSLSDMEKGNNSETNNVEKTEVKKQVPESKDSEGQESEVQAPSSEDQGSDGQSQSEGQESQEKQQQAEEPMEESNESQPQENNSGEPMELEPGEVPVDTKTIGVNKILPAKYFSREARGRLVSAEEFSDPNISKITVTGIRQPCIMVFDSLSGVSRSRIVNILKEYLQVEWTKKKKQDLNLKERLRGCSPKVPQQTNYSDCGVYVLQYVESFFEDPIQDFSFPMKSLQHWFTGERIRRKREEIKELVLTISEVQSKS